MQRQDNLLLACLKSQGLETLRSYLRSIAASALNGQFSFTRTVVQHSGHAYSCDVPAFKRLALQSQQSTACMSAHDIEARLCRLRDLRRSDELFLTQEFLGEMLGVRRNSATVAAQTLQRAGMITYEAS